MSDLIKPKPCPKCGLRFQCLCEVIPQLNSNISLALLMHPNELDRDTNTGKLLTQTLVNCHSYVWSRKQPDKKFLKLINDPDTTPLILFPGKESIEISEHLHKRSSNNKLLFILLDSTWQEATKMMNKSSWLKDIPKVHLNVKQTSKYLLRKNQQAGHLCTCEVGIELLTILNEQEDAKKLTQFFDHYLSVFKADKSGHLHKKNSQ